MRLPKDTMHMLIAQGMLTMLRLELKLIERITFFSVVFSFTCHAFC